MSRSHEPLQLDGEEWRKVAEFPGYEVSSLGRFRSYWTPGGLSDEPHMKMVIHNRYMKVAIHTPTGKNTLVLFSKLVAEAFIGKANGRVIIYLDDNVQNCKLSNLTYATRQELGEILTKRRFRQDPVNSSLGKKMQLQEKREAHFARARAVKVLRDRDRMTYKQIGTALGISESGAYRIYAGAHNHILAKALAQ